MNIFASSKRAARLCLFGLLSILTTSALFSDTDEFVLRAVEGALDGPVQIKLKNGNAQSGRITAWDGQNLSLEITLGAGSAIMTFEAEQVRAIRFPGDAYLDWLREIEKTGKNVEQGLELYRAFYKQRVPYLRFLNQRQIGLFVNYARFALANGKPLRAVAIIEVLRPYIDDPLLLDSFDNSVLLGLFLGGMREEAAKRAAEWVDAEERGGFSALGWRILAEIQFLEEKFETAMWTALYPIAFANQIPVEHLDICYAFAIASAEENRQPEIADRLYAEMLNKGFIWPSDIPALSGLEPVIEETTDEIEPNKEASALIEELEEPIQTPSPVDPLESLPTRIQQISETDNDS